MNLRAWMYEADDPHVDNLLDVLTMTTPMNVEINGDIFPTL